MAFRIDDSITSYMKVYIEEWYDSMDKNDDAECIQNMTNIVNNEMLGSIQDLVYEQMDCAHLSALPTMMRAIFNSVDWADVCKYIREYINEN